PVRKPFRHRRISPQGRQEQLTHYFRSARGPAAAAAGPPTARAGLPLPEPSALLGLTEDDLRSPVGEEGDAPGRDGTGPLPGSGQHGRVDPEPGDKGERPVEGPSRGAEFRDRRTAAHHRHDALVAVAERLTGPAREVGDRKSVV